MSRTWVGNSPVRLEGEECPRCRDSVLDQLKRTPGVRTVECDSGGRILVQHDPDRVTGEELDRILGAAPEGLEHRIVPVRGMDCPDCAATIEAVLARTPGIRFASLNFAAQRLMLEFDPSQITLPSIERVIRRLGYRVPTPGDSPRERLFDLRLLEVRLVLACGLLLLLGVGAWSTLGEGAWLPGGLWTLAALLGGWTPARRALGALRGHQVDMNCLMILAVGGALLLGEAAEAATVVFLFSLGEMLEGFAARRSHRAVELLLEQRPEVARVEREGQFVEVPAREVDVGESVSIRPGEQVPLDGRVIQGRSTVDQASVTGESVPVEKAPGDEVFAGTLNQAGALRVEVTLPYEDSTLARVLQVVEQAQTRKSDQQRFVDAFAARYTPAVVLGALLLATLGPWLLGGNFSEWAYRALVLLVIACPCALVISTPVSVVSALTGALRQGILIKGGISLERLARARVFALDKTGTLTRGSLQVVSLHPMGGLTSTELLALAAATEANSEHPLGLALVRHALDHGIRPEPAEEFQALPGRGAWARVQGSSVEVGRPELFAGSLDPEARALVEVLRDQGQTVVAVVRELVPVGLVSFSDAPRSEAAAALEELRTLGQRLVLVTGDHPRAAAPLAMRLGIQEVHAGLMPEGKLAVLRRFEEEGHPVVMVGDGINDSPALAAATVGVSLGAAGSAVALETADVALMGDDLRGLPAALRLARRARAVILQNIAFALVLKALFLLLALTGHAGMWMAIAADMGASLLVTANGLRLVGAASRSGLPDGAGHPEGAGHEHGPGRASEEEAGHHEDSEPPPGHGHKGCGCSGC